MKKRDLFDKHFYPCKYFLFCCFSFLLFFEWFDSYILLISCCLSFTFGKEKSFNQSATCFIGSGSTYQSRKNDRKKKSLNHSTVCLPFLRNPNILSAFRYEMNRAAKRKTSKFILIDSFCLVLTVSLLNLIISTNKTAITTQTHKRSLYTVNLIF